MIDEIKNKMTEVKRRHGSTSDSTTTKPKPKPFNKLIEHIKAKSINRKASTLEPPLPPSSSSSSLSQSSRFGTCKLHDPRVITRVRSKSIAAPRTTSKTLNSEKNQKHDFQKKSYVTPTLCFNCYSFINEQEGLSCRNCQENYHKMCGGKSLFNCFKFQSVMPSNAKSNEEMRQGFDDEDENDYSKIGKKKTLTDSSTIMSIETATTATTTATTTTTSTSTSSTNAVITTPPSLISPTQNKRLNLKEHHQLIKQNSAASGEEIFFFTGLILYWTNESNKSNYHEWKLDATNIFIFTKQNSQPKQIPLKSIVKVTLISSALMVNDSKKKRETMFDEHCLFSLRTNQNEIFYCGDSRAHDQSIENVVAKSFFNMFKIVYVPFSSGTNSQEIKDEFFSVTPPHLKKRDILKEFKIDFSDLLGSGQYGSVFGATCLKTNAQVAVKIVDKSKYDSQIQALLFKNELTLLSSLKHPGIVSLISLFDQANKLFIVQEKLSTDLLSVILSKENGRLDECTTKFIIYQIFTALDKLHSHKIAHCDMKPENILIAENGSLPYVKICDFGFAKIIGENSFRKSVTGTDYFAAPELKNRVYNNSIDLWSMGVIIFICLSGTFPFDEDEIVVEETLKNLFFDEDNLWKTISIDAKEVIRNLLEIKLERRTTIHQTLNQNWFAQDKQLYINMRDLEKRLNMRWLTSENQDLKWSIT